MTTQSKIFEVGIFGFLKILLRGAAQVMFQCNAWCGLLFIAGIFWGAYSSGVPEVAWGALLGVMVSTATGYILNLQAEEGQEGLWGFNGILVGCAFPTFLGDTVWMWIALALCAALSTWVRTGLNNLMRGWSINSFTFPFVLCTWFFLLGAHTMHSLPALHTSSHVMHSLHGLHHHMGLEGAWEAVQIWLRGISQVFLIDSWVTGLLFFLGLAASSRWAALWALIGSALSMGMAVVMVALVFAFDKWGSGSSINIFYAMSSYTFGPLLGMFAFGALSRREVRDGWVPAVALLSPAICLLLDHFSEQLFGGYQFGFEILLLNAGLTMLGLFLASKR